MGPQDIYVCNFVIQEEKNYSPVLASYLDACAVLQDIVSEAIVLLLQPPLCVRVYRVKLVTLY